MKAGSMNKSEKLMRIQHTVLASHDDLQFRNHRFLRPGAPWSLLWEGFPCGIIARHLLSKLLRNVADRKLTITPESNDL